MKQRFTVHFHPHAAAEFAALDGSVQKMVYKRLKELESRADEVGEPLRNTKYAKLAGCRKLKLRDAGIRVVYRITEQRVDILQVVEILAVGKRDKDEVYIGAQRRLLIEQAKAIAAARNKAKSKNK